MGQAIVVADFTAVAEVNDDDVSGGQEAFTSTHLSMKHRCAATDAGNDEPTMASAHSPRILRGDIVVVIVPVFVDDVSVAARDLETANKFLADLKTRVQIRELGPTKWLLGV